MEDYDVLRSGEDNQLIEPIDVYIRIGISKIYDIDTINQRFHAEIIVESKWHDPNLKSLKDDVKEFNWRPELYIDNALNDPKEEITYKIIYDEEAKMLMISEIRKVKGIFWENLELENFPLDIQDLSILIASRKSGRKVNFVQMQPDYSRVSIANTLDKSAWQLRNIVRTFKDQIVREYSFGRREYPAINHTCQAYRLPGYFYWNALLPIFLISFASLGPFLIDPRSAHTRLPSTATMLLASVSYKATVNRLLPTVSYLTSLDKYGLGSIVIITVMFIYHSMFSLIGDWLKPEWAYLADKFAFVVFLSLMLVKQFIYAIWLTKVNSYRNKLRDDFKFHESISIDRRKKID